jgi:hypothetical protein
LCGKIGANEEDDLSAVGLAVEPLLLQESGAERRKFGDTVGS